MDYLIQTQFVGMSHITFFNTKRRTIMITLLLLHAATSSYYIPAESVACTIASWFNASASRQPNIPLGYVVKEINDELRQYGFAASFRADEAKLAHHFAGDLKHLYDQIRIQRQPLYFEALTCLIHALTCGPNEVASRIRDESTDIQGEGSISDAENRVAELLHHLFINGRLSEDSRNANLLIRLNNVMELINDKRKSGNTYFSLVQNSVVQLAQAAPALVQLL